MIQVDNTSGAHVTGEIEISSGETAWLLHPAQPWEPGDYRVVVDSRLEDRSGNSVAKPFEVDLSKGNREPPSAEPIVLSFTVTADDA